MLTTATRINGSPDERKYIMYNMCLYVYVFFNRVTLKMRERDATGLHKGAS